MKAPKQNRDQNLIFEAYTNKQILNETAFAALMAVLRSSGPFAVKQALRVALKTKAVSPQWVASQSGIKSTSSVNSFENSGDSYIS